MLELSSTQLAGALRRANCCFADLAYESTKAFAIGNMDKAFCEFEKAEGLFHYINALRCYNPVEEEDTEAYFILCFPFSTINNIEFIVDGEGYFSSGPQLTLAQLVTAINTIPGGTITAEILGVPTCIKFTFNSGGEDNNGITWSFYAEQIISQAPFPAEGVFAGAGDADSINCLTDDNAEILFERIEEICGCCACHDKDFELTNDTL